MKIDKITLHNFRNLIDQSVDFGPNLNIICGNTEKDEGEVYINKKREAFASLLYFLILRYF